MDDGTDETESVSAGFRFAEGGSWRTIDTLCSGETKLGLLYRIFQVSPLLVANKPHAAVNHSNPAF